MGSSFSHVAQCDHISDLDSAIRADDTNLAYAPLIIDPRAQAYMDGLDLSPNGEFAHITNPYGHDPSIGPWKSLFFSDFVTDPEQFDQDILFSRMTDLPDRAGKSEFAALISTLGKTYWPSRENEHGMSLSLMLKYAATNPKFHVDGGVTHRGLATLRGNEEKGATKILSNDAVNIWQRHESGLPYINPIGEAGKDFEVENHQITHIPMRTMSIHQGVPFKMHPALQINTNPETGHLAVEYEIYGEDQMAEANPLIHSEPSDEDCPEPRLQVMMN